MSRTVRIAVLSWVAGTVDTFAYLSLGGSVFVTHLTGNVAVVAIAAVQHRYAEVLQRGAIVPLFFAGALLGAALVESPDTHAQVRRALAIEATALGVYVVIAGMSGVRTDASELRWVLELLPLTLAMGVQNAALSDPAARGSHTTHITGPTTDFAAEIVHLLLPTRRHNFSVSRAARFGARCFSFAAGAVCGAVIQTHAPISGLLIPATVVGTVAWMSADRNDTKPPRRVV